MKTLTSSSKTSLAGLEYVDLFCGIGAFHLALDSYGCKCVFACDNDKNARQTYHDNFHRMPSGDIRIIAETAVPAHDILCAGFPCQPFSISGKQGGFTNPELGTLIFDVIRIAKYRLPKVILLENVKNLVVHDSGKTMDTIVKSLEDIDYNVFYKVLDSANYGIPQKRDRVYIVAIHKSLNVHKFDFPLGLPLTKHLCDVLEPATSATPYLVNRDDVVLRTHLDKSDSKPVRLGEVGKGRQGERIYSTRGTAITLTSIAHGVGGSTGMYLDNGKLRKLSPRECARCMGFPDSYILAPYKTIALAQLGNSIVVDVLQYILAELAKLPEIQALVASKV